MKTILLILTFIWSTTSYSQNLYDVIIEEIMADPAPAIALPNNEWIELKNISPHPINIQNWRIGDNNGISGPLPFLLLQPDSLIIICANSSLPPLSVLGRAISVTSFPTLDNNGELIYLKAPNGKTIHSVEYSSQWYNDAFKMEGGWTIEMIDTRYPCLGKNNWKASINTAGGTPGYLNSINGQFTGVKTPVIKNAFTLANDTILIEFDEPIDSISGSTTANFSLEASSLINASVLSPAFTQSILTTANRLIQGKVYTLTISNIKNCMDQYLPPATIVNIGIPQDPLSGEWVINEILFNPRSGASDFVEFYNNSNNIFDASSLYVSNRTNTGDIGSIRQLTTTPYYIFPGDYILLTPDTFNLKLHYLVKNKLLQLASLPSLPDDEGSLVALGKQGNILDEIYYKDDWHFKLISNPEGVSLERLDPSATTQDPNNWYSAASTAGYATPGYKNSQYKNLEPAISAIEISPIVFSPNNDGRDDLATISYSIAEPGFMANVALYDASGRQVRQLVGNQSLALKGWWNWDGLNNEGSPLRPGIYIVLLEFFNLNGKKQMHKKSIVLAR